jgi:hypothetical protein
LPPNAAEDAAWLVTKDQPEPKDSVVASLEPFLNHEFGFSVCGSAALKSADGRDKDDALNPCADSRIEERS